MKTFIEKFIFLRKKINLKTFKFSWRKYVFEETKISWRVCFFVKYLKKIIILEETFFSSIVWRKIHVFKKCNFPQEIISRNHFKKKMGFQEIWSRNFSFLRKSSQEKNDVSRNASRNHFKKIISWRKKSFLRKIFRVPDVMIAVLPNGTGMRGGSVSKKKPSVSWHGVEGFGSPTFRTSKADLRRGRAASDWTTETMCPETAGKLIQAWGPDEFRVGSTQT